MHNGQEALRGQSYGSLRESQDPVQVTHAPGGFTSSHVEWSGLGRAGGI